MWNKKEKNYIKKQNIFHSDREIINNNIRSFSR